MATDPGLVKTYLWCLDSLFYRTQKRDPKNPQSPLDKVWDFNLPMHQHALAMDGIPLHRWREAMQWVRLVRHALNHAVDEWAHDDATSFFAQMHLENAWRGHWKSQGTL